MDRLAQGEKPWARHPRKPIARKEDWYKNPKTAEEVTFIDFARSEGRFAKHFDKDGNPSQTLLWAKQERLENWHVLQELAGLR